MLRSLYQWCCSQQLITLHGVIKYVFNQKLIYHLFTLMVIFCEYLLIENVKVKVCV